MQTPFATNIGGPIYLHSHRSGANLKVQVPGLGLNGRGKWAKFAKFLVRPTQRGPNVIRLSPWTNAKMHVKIPKNGNRANALGGLGKQSLLQVVPRPAKGLGVVSLRSVLAPHQHVGVLPNGEMKLTAKTGQGIDGHFTVVSGWMRPGARVHLESVGTGKNLAWGKFDGKIHAAGGQGKWAKWTVVVPNPAAPNVVMLQHFVFPGKYLAIGKNRVPRFGAGGKWCHFWARPAGKHKINLRSVAHGNVAALGFGKNGKYAHAPGKVGVGPFGQFRVHHW